MTFPTLKIGTTWQELEVLSEPEVILGFSGYAPVVKVLTGKSKLEKYLYISAKSLAIPLEEMRISNRGFFVGIRVKIRKESEDRFSKYVLERL